MPPPPHCERRKRQLSGFAGLVNAGDYPVRTAVTESAWTGGPKYTADRWCRDCGMRIDSAHMPGCSVGHAEAIRLANLRGEGMRAALSAQTALEEQDRHHAGKGPMPVEGGQHG